MTKKARRKFATASVAAVSGLIVLVAVAFLILAPQAPDAASDYSNPAFTFSDQAGLSGFSSNIPVIVLLGDRAGSVSGSKTYSPFTMEVFEPRTGGVVRPFDGSTSPAATLRTGVRLRGQVSRLFPKLSYRLKLQDGNGASQAKPLLGMPADADWALQGPWLDKSLI
jgi:hypothetical protein